MKNTLLALLVSVAVQASWAAGPPANIRTIHNLRGFPVETLRHLISRPLFRSLEVSPVEAWVEARAPIYSGKTANAKIVRSEENGAYDKMILQMANSIPVTGTNQIESRVASDSLTLHLLVFKIADGQLAICFARSEDARYVGYHQTGAAWIGILKNGEWKTVSKNNKS